MFVHNFIFNIRIIAFRNYLYPQKVLELKLEAVIKMLAVGILTDLKRIKMFQIRQKSLKLHLWTGRN